MNPIHHDEPFATSSGYPAPLTVGMFQAGVLTTWATNWLGPENVRRTRIRWKAAVFPGDVLTMSGAVSAKREEEAEVDLELACTKADGSVCVQAWMTFVIR
jgi:acyl dehydratase